MTRIVVGVSPPEESARLARLLEALELAYPVRFEPRHPGEWAGLRAVVLIGSEAEQCRAAGTGLSLFMSASKRPDRQARPLRIEFATSSQLAQPLQGRALEETKFDQPVPVEVHHGEAVLASCSGAPIWVTRRRRNASRHRVSYPIEELEPNEPLRDRLHGGRFISLLPLVHFLREITTTAAWVQPPLRAAFMIDDPNLHWPSYGHLRFSDVARDAERHAYHLATATIPLDGWLVHPGAVQVFRESTHVSLLIHGNNHVKAELTQPSSEAEAAPLLAQALRRVAALERRSGVSVDRVMVAPHGVCSAMTMRAMVRIGFESICYSWRSRKTAVSGWEVGDFVAGLPLIPRVPLVDSDAEVVFLAFLGQPVVLYGHHTDLASGLGVLSEAARAMTSMGDVRWISLGDICRSNFETMEAGTTQRIRLFSRRVIVMPSEGIEELSVEVPATHDEASVETVVFRERDHVPVAQSLTDRVAHFPVSGTGPVEVSLVASEPIDANEVPNPPWRPWPLLRRTLSEARDRLHPAKR